MTKELRERLYEKFKSYYDRGAGYEIIEMEMLALLEQEIIEAERRMKERCLECIPPNGNSRIGNTWKDMIRTAISSLK